MDVLTFSQFFQAVIEIETESLNLLNDLQSSIFPLKHKRFESTILVLKARKKFLRQLDDYEKQKDLLTRALEIKEKHYGKDHPQTAITLNNRGNAWGDLGDYEKKKDLLTRALEINEKHYGKGLQDIH